MKIRILYLIFLIILLGGNDSIAQTEKGAKMLGGRASVGFDDPFYISIYPNIGFFVVNNLAVGATMIVNYSRTDFYSSTNAGLLPFVRVYFGQTQTRIFAQGSFGYIHEWQKSFNQMDDVIFSEGNTLGSADLGITRFITDQIGLEVALNYTHFFVEDPIGNLTLNVGFQIFLPSSR